MSVALQKGRFGVPSGKAKSAPVRVDLKAYPVKLDDGDLCAALGG